jgi:hypothetical protein
MKSKLWVKLAITVPLLAVLVVLDGILARQGVLVLAIGLGAALLVGERLRGWLRERERPNLAMVPFMAAALVLLVLFCQGRNLHQGLLLAVSIGVVYTLLMVALAAIAEVGKRGVRGAAEFAGAAGLGLALGLALSLVFLLEPGQLGGASLAGP